MKIKVKTLICRIISYFKVNKHLVQHVETGKMFIMYETRYGQFKVIPGENVSNYIVRRAKMKKSELKNETIVELSEGTYYLVSNNKLIGKGQINLAEYDENLQIKFRHCKLTLDIVKEYKIQPLDIPINRNNIQDGMFARLREGTILIAKGNTLSDGYGVLYMDEDLDEYLRCKEFTDLDVVELYVQID